MISVQFNQVCVVELEATLSTVASELIQLNNCISINHKAARFIKGAVMHSTNVLVYHNDKLLPHDMLRVVVNANTNDVSLLKGQYGGRATSLLRDVSPHYLSGYTPELDKLRSNVGKIVRFSYKGGSHHGVRVVKLEEVVGHGPTVTLKGRDLAAGLDSEAFRAYNLSKVEGPIEVLN